MRTVEGPEGRRYLLLKESGESSLVRDPSSGRERYLPNEDVEPVSGEAPLRTAADAVPDAVQRAAVAVHDPAALGLLVELADRGPLPVRTMLESYERCESDLHGDLAEFGAAGLVEETTVTGRPGYALTADGRVAVDALRGVADDSGGGSDDE